MKKEKEEKKAEYLEVKMGDRVFLIVKNSSTWFKLHELLTQKELPIISI